MKVDAMPELVINVTLDGARVPKLWAERLRGMERAMSVEVWLKVEVAGKAARAVQGALADGLDRVRDERLQV